MIMGLGLRGCDYGIRVWVVNICVVMVFILRPMS